MQTIEVRSTEREQFVDITHEVSQRLGALETSEGICTLYVQHTTAGLTINENADPDVQRDMIHFLRKLVPREGMNFRHMEGNSDAHIKSSLMGSSVTIPYSKGKLLLGQWQGIYLCEFDGPRRRRVVMVLCPATA